MGSGDRLRERERERGSVRDLRCGNVALRGDGLSLEARVSRLLNEREWQMERIGERCDRTG